MRCAPSRGSSAVVAALSLLSLAVAVTACGEAKEPIAKLATSPAELQLPWSASNEIEIAIVPERELPEGVDLPIVFVHLLDEPGSVVRTFDHKLRGAWREGKELRYQQRIFQSALAEPLPAGRYLLSIGLYDAALGRFALATSAPEIAKQEYQVATVEVPAAASAGPEAHFSGDWLAPEPSADRQVVASRRLRGGAAGTIAFGPLTGPGTIHLGFLVPGAGGVGARLEVAGDGPQPKVKVSSSCGGQQSEVSGRGRFDLEIAVSAGAAPAVCELVVEPNFDVRLSDRVETTSIWLEELSYSMGADGGS